MNKTINNNKNNQNKEQTKLIFYKQLLKILKQIEN